MIKQAGFTFIECLISSAIGLFLLSIILTIYLSTQATCQYIAELSQIIENGKTATALLMDDIRMAGYIGCRNFAMTPMARANELSPPFVFNEAIISDRDNAITIEKASHEFANLAEAMADKVTIILRNNISWQAGEWLIISDCKGGELFKISQINRHNGFTTIVTDRPLTRNYGLSAQLRKATAITYFVAATDRKNSRGKYINALYRRDLYASEKIPDEMITGVDDLKTSYGIRTNNLTTVENISAEEVTRLHLWPYVISVKITLQISANGLVLNNHLLHKEWPIYVALRNRLHP